MAPQKKEEAVVEEEPEEKVDPTSPKFELGGTGCDWLVPGFNCRSFHIYFELS